MDQWVEYELLSEKQLKLIEEEEIENKINVDEEVKKIIEWINEQPHLPKYLDGEKKIRNFLYGRKFSIERTKKTLDAYYTIRGALPEFFANRDPLDKSLQHMMRLGYSGVLPKLTTEGYRIAIVGNRAPHETAVIEDFYKYLIMMSELLLLNDLHRGFIIILDFRNVTFQMMMLHTLPAVKKLVHYGLQCFPSRIKGIYCINAPGYFDYLGNLIKSTLSEKLQSRLFIHSREEGYEPLLKISGRNNLPNEFGGTLGPLEDLIDQWNKILISYRDWLLGEGSRKTDESRRDGKDKFDPEAVFGMTGSFRKLTVD